MAEFSIKVAGIENKQEIYDVFLNSFFPNMPLFSGLNVTKPFEINEWAALHTLEDGLTLIAVSNEEEIMGYAINCAPRDVEVVGIPPGFEKHSEVLDEDTKGLLSKLEKSTVELRELCVDKKWRGHGISNKLVADSEILAKKHGYKNIYSVPTGDFSEAAFKMNGWECVYRLYYRDYCEKYDKYFKVPEGPHTSLTIYEKTFD